MYSKNAWEKYSDESLKELMDFNESYKEYISKGKTERLCVKESEKLAIEKGFVNIESVKELKNFKLLNVAGGDSEELIAKRKELQAVYNQIADNNRQIQRRTCRAQHHRNSRRRRSWNHRRSLRTFLDTRRIPDENTSR